MPTEAVLFRIVTLGLILGFGSAAQAVEKSSPIWQGLERMMTVEEFEAAGLRKLSPAELERLNEWMMHFIAHDSQQVVKTDEKIRDLQNEPVRRRIVGSFQGWDGNTTFTLDNGEVWKQRLPGKYSVELDNPEVEIRKNLLGFHELRVIQTGKKIGVTRLR
jgi:hypothetical protein